MITLTREQIEDLDNRGRLVKGQIPEPAQKKPAPPTGPAPELAQCMEMIVAQGRRIDGLAKAPIPAPRVWKFQIRRDKDGFIESITATAEEK